MSDQTSRELGEYIDEKLAAEIVSWDISYGELTIEVVAEHIIKVLGFLSDDSRYNFKMLIDICGVDYPARAKRFEVVYHLLSLISNLRIRVKIKTSGEKPVDSVISLFPNANWYEREAYDMYGIEFSGHPDLRRLLTDYGFEGHPLRKDFPLSGHVEVRYDNELQRVVYEPVKLAQEYRNFDFESPWEAMSDLITVDKASDGDAETGKAGGDDE